MKAVIFDLDGTLVDSAADLQAAANRLMRQNGLPELDLATVTCFIGDGIARLVERCFAHNAALPARELGDMPAQIARFKAFYAAEGHRRTRLMPGAGTALRRLAAGGTVLGLCTNKDAALARDVLRKLGVEQLFTAVVGGNDGLTPKPDPAPLRACLDACGVSEAEAVYIGDNQTDAATAKAAGLPFLLYTEGYRNAPCATLPQDGAFSSFAALPGIVANLSTAAPSASAIGAAD